MSAMHSHQSLVDMLRLYIWAPREDFNRQTQYYALGF